MSIDTGFYSIEKLEEIESKLNQLPDLSKKRFSKSDSLEILKESIKTLKNEKGYTISEIIDVLKELGFDTITQKEIKNIVETKKRTRKSKSNKSDS
ncbi:hypothetical protein ACUMKS_003557 [Proteus mirabilis]|uniref:hypothetical protein n=1 Tax=Proteus mirabilis TaxID=584 RepID=UPI001A22E5EF|nr:hypothetical protein [Proteus mirabilis]HEM8286038.1 hypothetical protein [Providencia stuartii]EKU3803954.1 hypothetical protein [Proteus mirabilis]EKV7963197.1 hypothetical protein [Proteus mirabilis]ELB1171926.1 hypothetical protein [Proteus mirabilis]ELB2631285.1 hypothetical protein [Proteus mirabilis]